MKKILSSTTKFICAAAIVLSFACLTARAAEGDLKLEAQLVLGTNDEKSKDGFKPVTKDIEKKLKRLPLKWNHYYIETGKKFNIAADGTKKVTLSKSCQISVKNLGGSKVELTLVSQDKTVGRITQSLRKGQTLIAGAGADNSIVVLYQQ
ncbi:MAG TPA: hypothetical protein VN516_08550 [Candidatus Baltobacteraceae bacterium]|nr:hypothetical protein [Candidatus Baltobacteraceae bacterium]